MADDEDFAVAVGQAVSGHPALGASSDRSSRSLGCCRCRAVGRQGDGRFVGQIEHARFFARDRALAGADVLAVQLDQPIPGNCRSQG